MELNWMAARKWIVRGCGACLAAACCLAMVAVAAAADATFVGVLATAVDDSSAAKLQLSPAEKQALLKLIDEREAAAVELSATLRSLSPAEQEAKLAPFRKESEKLGLQLLKPEQRQRLESIRLERLGLAAVAEPAVAEKLDLSDEQVEEIAELVAARNAEIAKSPPFKHQALRNEFERKLLAVLDESQRADWEDQISDSAAGKVADGSKTPATIAADDVKPSVDKPGADKPGADKPGADKPTADAAKPSAEKPLADSSKPTTAKPGIVPDKPARPDVKATLTADGKLRFNFRFQPWRDVLDWFAEAADFSLVSDTIPPGTFNYQDSRAYTPAEAIDLLNSVLLTKGYTLVRRERLLMVVNLQDGVPPNLVATVAPEDLEKRGQFELVNSVFHVEKLTPEEAETEIKKLLGPQGSIVVLPKAHQLSVTETAGRLLTIRRVLEAVENPEGNFGDRLSTFTFQHMTATDALAVVKQMFNIPTDKSATSDGTLRLATDPAGSKLLVSGKPSQVAQASAIIKTLDVPGGGGDAGLATADGAPQLEIYSITSADPAAALQVMQTLLAGLPDVRLATDPKTGNLVALARPSQHATIRATLEQMQRDARQVEVIRLHSVDPQLAVLSINKLFAPEGEGALSGPKVEADATLRQLLIRGTTSQVEQIRSLLEKMGETDTKAVAGTPAKGNVRMIPLGGRSATNALSQIEKLWPALHRNKIRIVTPSAVIPTLRLNEVVPPATPGGDTNVPAIEGTERQLRQPPALRQPRPQVDSPAADRQRKAKPSSENAVPVDPQTSHDSSVQMRLVARRGIAAKAAVQRQTGDATEADADAEAGPTATESTTPSSKAGAEIIVAPGKGGIMIASEDTQALDEFESLLNTIGSRSFSGTREFTVFYLKYAKAAAVSELLEQIFGGGGSSSGGGGGGSLLGDLVGGGLMGSLLGGGGGGESSSPGFVTGTVAIVPDTRLNALVVQANPTDLGTVEDLLRILDQKQSPEEVLVSARPRMIPVYNTTAENVATAVRQVYQDRLVSAAGQNRQPNPEEFMRALRGGRGGGGDSRRKENEAEKLSVAVDERTNSLIISASDALFSEVKDLVAQLDLATSASQVVTRVVTLKKANPQSVQEAVTAVLGDAAESSDKPKSNRRSGQGNQSSSDGDRRDRGGDDGNRQRMDMFNMMRESGGFGGGGGGPFGGGGGRGGGGGSPFGGGGGPGGGRGFGGRGQGGGGGGDRGR